MIKLFLFIVWFVTFGFALSLNVVRVPGNLEFVNVKSKAWMSSDFTRVKLYPSMKNPSNDRVTNEMNKNLKEREAFIKILQDGKHIAFLIKWSDDSLDVDSVDTFADAVSISVPKENTKYPYIRYIDKKRELMEYYQKVLFDTDGEKSVFKIFTNENLKKIFYMKTDMRYEDGYWMASFVKDLNDKYMKLNRNFIPFFISLWDGRYLQRGYIKFSSPWIVAKLQKDEESENMLRRIEKVAKGDIENGEKLVKENCAVCHRYKNTKEASPYTAPNLSHIGSLELYDYIKESILKPGVVIAKNYNFKAHKNHPWSEKIDNEEISLMPSFSWLDEKSLEDIISYLQTLK